MNESQTEIPAGIPHCHTFCPQPGAGTGIPTTLTVYGPSPSVPKSANNYGFVSVATGLYSCSFLPDELGIWTVVATDSGGVALHSSTFRCVRAPKEEFSYRLTNKYRGLIEIRWDFFNLRQNAKAVSSITCSGTTVTANSTSHGFSNGQKVTIVGAVPSGYAGLNNAATSTGYNGSWAISGLTTNSFQYTVPAALSSPATGTIYAFGGTQGSGSSISNAGTTYAAFISTKKCVIPQSGYIYGIRTRFQAAMPTVTAGGYCKFFTMASDGTVRGMSEDIGQAVPTEGNYSGSADGWYTFYFKVPVPARAGDYWGYEIKAAAGQENTLHSTRTSIWSFPAATQEIKYRPSNSSGLSLTGTNALSTYGGGTFGCLEVRPPMRPPAVVVAGHSFYSGFGDVNPGSVSVFDYNTQNNSRPFDATQDLAALMEQHLGLPCINAAVGGSKFTAWVGQRQIATGNDSAGQGWFEWLVAPLRPAAVLFDTAYNDAAVTSGITLSIYLDCLDRLLWHCDQYGIELILMEPPPSAATLASAQIANLERFRNATRVWCRQNGVCLIPCYYRMGQFSGYNGVNGIEKIYQRWVMKGSDSGGFLPNYQDGAAIHFNDFSRPAFAALLAEGIRSRAALPPMYAGTGSDETTLVQPGARGINAAAINGGG